MRDTVPLSALSVTLNLRQSFRCLHPPNGSPAILRVEDRDQRVRIIDESAGGLAIASQRTLRVKVGQHLLLRTPAGWTQVELKRISRDGRDTILGLNRVCDLTDPGESSGVSSPFWKPRLRRKADRGRRPNAVATLLLVLVVALLATCYVQLRDVAGFAPPTVDESPLRATDLSITPAGSASHDG